MFKGCTVDKLIPLIHICKDECGGKSTSFDSGFTTLSMRVSPSGECWCRDQKASDLSCNGGDAYLEYEIVPNMQGTPYMYRNVLVSEYDVAFSVQYDAVYTPTSGGPYEMEIADTTLQGQYNFGSNSYSQPDYSNICKECPANTVAKWPSDNIEILWGGPIYSGQAENCEACADVTKRRYGDNSQNTKYDGTRNLWWSHCHVDGASDTYNPDA